MARCAQRFLILDPKCQLCELIAWNSKLERFLESLSDSTSFSFDDLESPCTYSLEETSAHFGKSSLKHSLSFRFLLSNQRIAHSITSTVITPLWRNQLLSNYWSNVAGLVRSRRPEFAVNWYLFPQGLYLKISLKDTCCLRQWARIVMLSVRELKRGCKVARIHMALIRCNIKEYWLWLPNQIQSRFSRHRVF